VLERSSVGAGTDQNRERQMAGQNSFASGGRRIIGNGGHWRIRAVNDKGRSGRRVSYGMPGPFERTDQVLFALIRVEAWGYQLIAPVRIPPNKI